MFEPLGFYINSMFEKTAGEKVHSSDLIIDSYNNGLEVGMGIRDGLSYQTKTASQALGREVFFDFATKLFLNK